MTTLMMSSYTKIFSSLRQPSRSISTSSMLAVTHLLPLALFLLLPCQCLLDLHMILLRVSENDHNLFKAKLRNFSTFLPIQSCHPIWWWYSNCHQFPNLYHLARDVLAIPGRFLSPLSATTLARSWFILFSTGSAVAVERIFSGGRDTISLWHTSLKPDIIWFLMLVKQHIHMHRM